MRTAFALMAVLLGACLDRAALQCADGTVCPLDRVCIPGGCALPEQLTACEGVPDGMDCTFSGVPGQCMSGVCIGEQCGNGEIDEGEGCDDGNTVSGDGCRADCAKLEACGDGVLDEGEACDDGNQNPVDGCDAQCQPTSWSAEAIVGGFANAATAGFDDPDAVAVDIRGNVYVADSLAHRIVRIEPTGVVTRVAGVGTAGYSGDGGPATSAELDAPRGIAVDALGNLYIGDTDNHVVRRVDAGGTITTIAGTGAVGITGDDGPATAATLTAPMGLALDGLGNLYIADRDAQRVRRVDTDGTITTIAGTTAGFSGNGGQATAAQLHDPRGVAVDALGRIYIADQANHRIRRIDQSGVISTFAGNSSCATTCVAGFGGDSGPATAALLSSPSSVAIAGDGSVYIADSGNERVRRVDPGNTITTFAGNGSPGGFAGDGGPAAGAKLSMPTGVALDPAGRLMIADRANNRIRVVDTGTNITTLAGSGARGETGDGGFATSATVSAPAGMALDATGNLYIAEPSGNRVRRVSPSGVITTVAGTGDAGYRASDEGGRAVNAWLDHPSDVVVDAAGNLFIADTDNSRIRKVDASGNITTYAGTGTAAYDGDSAPAATKALNHPAGVALDGAGGLFIADTDNHRIRRVDAGGTITTFAGTGTAGFGGDTGAATSAKLTSPWAVAVSGGEVYISDQGNQRIRRVDASNNIFTFAGNGTAGFAGDGGAAASAMLSTPTDIAFDTGGNLLVADSANHRIRRVTPGGTTISTVVGTGAATSTGDGGTGAAAAIASPTGLVVDGAGTVFIATGTADRVRRVTAGGSITTFAGLVEPRGMGPLPGALLAQPMAFVVAPAFTIVAGGTTGTVQLIRSGSIEAAAGRYDQAASTGSLAHFRSSSFSDIAGVAYDDAAGVIYVTESAQHRISAITVVDPADVTTWTITTVANASGTPGFANGSGATARFRNPTGLYLDATAHRLYVADTGNHAIRTIDLSAGLGGATVSTFAGTPGTRGDIGDGNAATQALLYEPRAIARCPGGDLFIADTGNHKVRRIAAGSAVISTVLGDGTAASSGEGAPSSTFPVNSPRGLTCDTFGNVIVTSTTAVRLLGADATGIVDGTGRVATIYGGAGTEFPASVTKCLTGIASIDDATLRVSDSCTGLLVELHLEGM